MIDVPTLRLLLRIPGGGEETSKELEYYRDAAVAEIEQRTQRKFAPEGARPTGDELPRNPDLAECVAILVRLKYDHADDLIEGKVPNSPWQGVYNRIDKYRKF